jgi:hypothetical protein
MQVARPHKRVRLAELCACDLSLRSLEIMVGTILADFRRVVIKGRTGALDLNNTECLMYRKPTLQGGKNAEQDYQEPSRIG